MQPGERGKYITAFILAGVVVLIYLWTIHAYG
jgi:hypothetical protein